jgi:molybdopterin molybdotransferase
MDGYAVRAEDIRGATADTPRSMPVSAVVRAGGDETTELAPGTAVRIMTGAPVPIGADSVVRVEDTDREQRAGTVVVTDDRDAGRHVRPAGQDMRVGSTLLKQGRTVTPGVIGVLAASGYGTVPVRRTPSVAFLATGDELRGVDRYGDVTAGRGIPDSNRPMLSAMARSIGCRPVDIEIARDDPDDLRSRLRDARVADVLVTIGGASMGEADLVKRVLDGEGFEQEFWRVRMRPGSPVSFGWLVDGDRRQPVFGLPGNPSSAFVTFELFVRPFLLRMAGHRDVFRRTVRCVAAEEMETPAALTYFQRVVVTRDPSGQAMAASTGPQLSGLVRGLAGGDGLAVVPPHVDAVLRGDPVDVLLLDPGFGVSDHVSG